MKARTSTGIKANSAIALVCIALSASFGMLATPARAASDAAQASLPAGMVDVVGLTKAGFGEEAILAKVKSAGRSYDLTTDQMIYLKNQGVSENVISALLQAGPASTPAPAASAPPVSPPPPSATASGRPSTPAPASAGSEGPPEVGGGESSAATTVPPPPPSAAPQENLGLVREHNGYTFEMKECKLEDRQDRPANDGRPHQQLACKVLVTDKMGDRKLSMCAEKDGEHTRVIDDMGNEYNCSGGSLGSSYMRDWGGLWPAELVLPSGVPVNATVSFGVNQGVGYFSQEAKSLAILDIVFKSNDTGAGSFHVQFKNVPIPLVESVQPPPPPVAAVTTTPGQPAPPAPTPEPVVNADYVQGQLTPYGSWVDVPGYGQCWQPSVLAGWRPYYDAGHWVYTDAGLYWQSDYPWGAIPFHYGSWTYAGGCGWVWVPGYEYAPARVFWRHTDGYLGWAPLPPGAVFVDGGWMFRGRRFAVDYDFGFGASFFVFVDSHHLWERDYHRFVLRGDEFHRIYGRSEISRLRRDEHGRFVHEGLDREHLERVTGRKVEERNIREVRERDHEVMRSHYAEAARTRVEKVRPEKYPNRETPGREVPGKETPGRETPGGKTLGRETLGKETPNRETSGGKTLGRETPGRETSGQETSGGKAPSTRPPTSPATPERTLRQTPDGKTPGKETPGKETPSKESPSKDNGKEKNKEQNQSKSNTNQHFALLNGTSGS